MTGFITFAFFGIGLAVLALVVRVVVTIIGWMVGKPKG